MSPFQYPDKSLIHLLRKSMKSLLIAVPLLASISVHASEFSEYCSSKDEKLAKTIEVLKAKLGESDCKKLEEKMALTKDLNLMNSGIQDIRPLNAAKGLISLKLGYDENYDGDVSKAPKVTNYNELETTRVQKLDLRNSGLTDDQMRLFHFSSNLLEVDLSGNNIKSFPKVGGLFANISSLKYDCITGYSNKKPVPCEKSEFDGDLKILRSSQFAKEISLKQPGVKFSNCEITKRAGKNLCDEVLSLNAEAVAKAFNNNLSGVTLCDPENSVLAQVDDGNGGKKIVRTAQNTWSDFKKDGDGYSSFFSAYHRNSLTGEVKSNKMYLKIVPDASENFHPITGQKKVQLQLSYDGGSGTPAAKYDIQINAKGEIDIFETSGRMFQYKRGKENVVEGAMYSPTNIKVSKTDGKTSYTIDNVLYRFTQEQIAKIEKETDKKFFTDKFNEKTEEFEGVTYTADEVNALGVTPVIKSGLNWSNCPAVTTEEILNFGKASIESHNKDVKGKEKKSNSFKRSSRESLKGKKEKAEKKTKKDTVEKAKAQ